ncbi:hypothetical protein NPIL_636151 [Nephila pilipes]|uniref:Uncharacterized protein n=1 Tax=Nephila pilipes TaxID=299642 RepID=A0A8X6TCT9_NEPPI|nr:hypothetical protein NPIL_636151 [Nephila pilipes]
MNDIQSAFRLDPLCRKINTRRSRKRVIIKHFQLGNKNIREDPKQYFFNTGKLAMQLILLFGEPSPVGSSNISRPSVLTQQCVKALPRNYKKKYWKNISTHQIIAEATLIN